MNARFAAVKNGSSFSRTGSKQVVFTPTLSLRPVLYAVYSGYQPERGTVQGARCGDLVASVTWGSQSEDYEIFRFGGDRLPLGEEARLWAELKRLHPWFDSFLEPSGRGSVFLPDSVVPEAEYLSVRAKRARIGEAISTLGLPYCVEEFARDPKTELHFEPRAMDVDLDTIQPSEYHWDGSVVGISRYERWFGSAGDGSPAIPLDIDPDYTSGSNYAYTDTEEHDGSPGVVGWRNYRFVVRVRHGAYTRDHFSYGHTVDVWEIPAEARHEAAA